MEKKLAEGRQQLAFELWGSTFLKQEFGLPTEITTVDALIESYKAAVINYTYFKRLYRKNDVRYCYIDREHVRWPSFGKHYRFEDLWCYLSMWRSKLKNLAKSLIALGWSMDQLKELRRQAAKVNNYGRELHRIRTST